MNQRSDHDENDPAIDLLLQQAFTNRPTGSAGRASLSDVRQRARHRQRRRAGSMVGATALLGVGAVAALTRRDDSAGVAGREAPDTALASGVPVCWSPQEGTLPSSTWFTLPATTWVLGTTTSGPPLSCIPPGQFRCLGSTGVDANGYSYFDYCEPVPGNPYPTVPATDPPPTATGPSVPLSAFVVIIDASGGLAGASNDMFERLDSIGGAIQLMMATR
ncbi:MAG: hypothetical protein WCC60_02700, partial [Ilumatobacteraceae bacterium]